MSPRKMCRHRRKLTKRQIHCYCKLAKRWKTVQYFGYLVSTLRLLFACLNMVDRCRSQISIEFDSGNICAVSASWWTGRWAGSRWSRCRKDADNPLQSHLLWNRKSVLEKAQVWIRLMLSIHAYYSILQYNICIEFYESSCGKTGHKSNYM